MEQEVVQTKLIQKVPLTIYVNILETSLHIITVLYFLHLLLLIIANYRLNYLYSLLMHKLLDVQHQAKLHRRALQIILLFLMQ